MASASLYGHPRKEEYDNTDDWLKFLVYWNHEFLICPIDPKCVSSLCLEKCTWNLAKWTNNSINGNLILSIGAVSKGFEQEGSTTKRYERGNMERRLCNFVIVGQTELGIW